MPRRRKNESLVNTFDQAEQMDTPSLLGLRRWAPVEARPSPVPSTTVTALLTGKGEGRKKPPRPISDTDGQIKLRVDLRLWSWVGPRRQTEGFIAVPNNSHLKVEGKADCHREERGDAIWFKNDIAHSQTVPSGKPAFIKVLLFYTHQKRQI